MNTARPVGLAVQSIPFTAIAEYFRIYELAEDFHEFSYVIRRLDDAFIRLNEEVQKAEKDSNGSGNGNKTNRNKG